jgi:hypothetical protein
MINSVTPRVNLDLRVSCNLLFSGEIEVEIGGPPKCYSP